MKKLLVVLLAAMMIVSVAAAAMAAVTVKGDFRYDFTMDSAKEGQDSVVDTPDLRLQFSGNVNDNLSAYMQIRTKNAGQQTVTDNIYDDDPLVLDNETKDYKVGSFYADEYHITLKQSFGTFKVGNWDWKTTPSRVNLKSNGFNVFPRTQTTLALDVPFESGLFAGIAYALDGNSPAASDVEDGGYDVKVGYKADVFGVEVHYFDTKTAAEATNIALDVYYQATDNIKAYVYANDPDSKATDADVDPVIGASFSNFLGEKSKVSLEYAVDKECNDRNFNPYFLTVSVPTATGIIFEVEHSNYMDGTEEETKTVVRGKFLF